MKVVAINGSPRKNGNTSLLIETVFDELRKHGIETEVVQLGGEMVHGCTGCDICVKTRNNKCVFDDDPINECIAKMAEADGIILGTPTYFTDVTTEMKALIDRAGKVSKANGDIFRHKAGGCVISVRRGGSIHAFDTMVHFMHYMQMFLVGASYWNMVYGRGVGEVLEDKEGILNMRVIGENMAYLLEKLNK